MTRRPGRGDDSGAALLLALILITVFALVLTAVLSFADTSMRVTVGLRGDASASYEAQGAVQAAINTIRNSAYNASAGQHCFGATDTLSLPGFAGGDSTAVSCSPDPTRVMIHCPSGSSCNRPGAAIITLGQVASEDGVTVQQNTGGVTRVHGAVFSNSTIDVANGTLSTNAAVYARGPCTGTIQAGQGPYCSYGSGANALGDDPGYAPASGTVPVHQPLPACTAPNSVVTFQPGYYDDANGLSAMMAGNSACRHSTWWFRPGTYYFDFRNDTAQPHHNPLLRPQGGDAWLVNDGYLVAGSPTNATGAGIAVPPVPAGIPGSCANPVTDPAAQGVQFIFGGDSQFQVGAKAQVEICGTYSQSRPPVALYGMPSGTETGTALAGATALRLTKVVSAGSFTNATTAALSDVDTTRYASFRRTGNGANAGTTLTVGGYAPPGAVPAGSILESATLRVVHRHSAAQLDGLTATVTPSGGSPLTASLPGLAGATTFQTDSVTLDAGSGALAQSVYAGTFTGATVALAVSLPANGDTEDIDAIQVDLKYWPPAYRAATGCVTATPYTGNGVNPAACAQILVPNGSGAPFYVQGTTYTPKAVVDVTLNNAAEQVFRSGIIARSVRVKETGSFAYLGPIIEVPDDSPGFAFSVYLSGYACPAAGTCTAGGTPRVRAKVAFVDADPANPVPGRRQVVVLSWSGPG